MRSPRGEIAGSSRSTIRAMSEICKTAARRAQSMRPGFGPKLAALPAFDYGGPEIVVRRLLRPPKSPSSPISPTRPHQPVLLLVVVVVVEVLLSTPGVAVAAPIP